MKSKSTQYSALYVMSCRSEAGVEIRRQEHANERQNPGSAEDYLGENEAFLFWGDLYTRW